MDSQLSRQPQNWEWYHRIRLQILHRNHNYVTCKTMFGTIASQLFAFFNNLEVEFVPESGTIESALKFYI